MAAASASAAVRVPGRRLLAEAVVAGLLEGVDQRLLEQLLARREVVMDERRRGPRPLRDPRDPDLVDAVLRDQVTGGREDPVPGVIPRPSRGEALNPCTRRRYGPPRRCHGPPGCGACRSRGSRTWRRSGESRDRRRRGGRAGRRGRRRPADSTVTSREVGGSMSMITRSGSAARAVSTSAHLDVGAGSGCDPSGSSMSRSRPTGILQHVRDVLALRSTPRWPGRARLPPAPWRPCRARRRSGRTRFARRPDREGRRRSAPR